MSESAAVTSVTSSLLVYQRKTRQILEELKGSALTAGRLQSLINQLRGAIFISFEPQGKEELFQLRKLELISCKIEESLKLLPSPKGITASQHLALSLFKTALQPFLLSLKERKSHVSTRYKIPGRYSPRPFRLPKITASEKFPHDFFAPLSSGRPPKPPSTKRYVFTNLLEQSPLSIRERKLLLSLPTAFKTNGVVRTIRQASAAY